MPHRQRRQSPNRAIVQIGLGLSLIALLIGVLWGLPRYGAGDGRSVIEQIYPPLWALPLFALTAGFGLALPLGCLWANRMHRKSLLRPTKARVLASLIMAALMPAGFTGIFPVPLWLVLSRNLFGLQSPEKIDQFFLFTPSPLLTLLYTALVLTCLTLMSFALLYAIARPWRVLAFVALWFGIASALVLAGYGYGFAL